MNGASNKGIAREMRRAVVTAVATASLCLPAAALIAQHQNNPRPAPAPHYSAPRQQTPAVHASAIAGPQSGITARAAISESGATAVSVSAPTTVPAVSSTGAGRNAQSGAEPVRTASGRARRSIRIQATTCQATGDRRIRALRSSSMRLLAISARGLIRIAMFRCRNSSRCCAVIRAFANCRRANSSA